MGGGGDAGGGCALRASAAWPHPRGVYKSSARGWTLGSQPALEAQGVLCGVGEGDGLHFWGLLPFFLPLVQGQRRASVLTVVDGAGVVVRLSTMLVVLAVMSARGGDLHLAGSGSAINMNGATLQASCTSRTSPTFTTLTPATAQAPKLRKAKCGPT